MTFPFDKKPRIPPRRSSVKKEYREIFAKYTKPVACCECKPALRLHNLGESGLVPTELKEGTQDICKFCGYTVFFHNPKRGPMPLNNQSILNDDDYVTSNSFSYERTPESLSPIDWSTRKLVDESGQEMIDWNYREVITPPEPVKIPGRVIDDELPKKINPYRYKK